MKGAGYLGVVRSCRRESVSIVFGGEEEEMMIQEKVLQSERLPLFEFSW